MMMIMMMMMMMTMIVIMIIIIIIIYPLFTLGSIYSSNASGAEQMPEISHYMSLDVSYRIGI